jgi:hypothetical protein
MRRLILAAVLWTYPCNQEADGRKMKPKRAALPKKRNFAAKQARDQKAGPMKDKRDGRGGARNRQLEDLKQLE